MRLWHKDLIEALPRKQLISQWRECCCIAKNISINGTPNHLLVNKVLKYPMDHLYTYGIKVYVEMSCRGYNCDHTKFTQYFTYPHETNIKAISDLFVGWHNIRYLYQCYYNLQEKYDCGGISDAEWLIVNDATNRLLKCQTSKKEF